MKNLARIMEIASELARLWKQVRAAVPPEKIAEIRQRIADLLNEYRKLLGSRKITAEDIARDLEAHARNQG